MQRNRHLGRTGLRVSRMGLGLAALGRPGYMTLGRDADLAFERSVDAMQARAFEVMDAAYRAGVRMFDAARSYGRAEAFLRAWIDARDLDPGDIVVSSKWGYAYTADWKIDADKHEVKELSLQQLLRQWELTRQQLWEYLDVYQIHSATLDSGVLDDGPLLDALRGLRAMHGVRLGLSVTGPAQAATIERAAGVEVDGERLFETVQATWNPLEPSAGPALLAAREAGMGVIIKESVANGRLTARGESTWAAEAQAAITAAAARHDVPVSVWALAAALAQPWADVVLSGAVTVEQLESNVSALGVQWSAADDRAMETIAERPEAYWAFRKSLPWA